MHTLTAEQEASMNSIITLCSKRTDSALVETAQVIADVLEVIEAPQGRRSRATLKQQLARNRVLYLLGPRLRNKMHLGPIAGMHAEHWQVWENCSIYMLASWHNHVDVLTYNCPQRSIQGQSQSASREVMLQLLQDTIPIALVTRDEAREVIFHLADTGHCSLRQQLLVSVSQSNIESVINDVVRRKVHPALCFVFMQVTGYELQLAYQ